MLGTLFNDPNLALDATWFVGGSGPGTACRVVLKQPDKTVVFGSSRAIFSTNIVDVRKSDIGTPAVGNTVAVGSNIYEVIADPMLDSLGLVWSCEAKAR